MKSAGYCDRPGRPTARLLRLDGVSGNNDDNGDDDGQGHQFIMSIGGHTYLYTLERANSHIDVDDLYVHEIMPTPDMPLRGTVGLLNPDGILGVVPGNK